MSAIMGMPMPTTFLHKQETEVILLQEVASVVIGLISGYNSYTNVGINKRGNAMHTRQTIKVPSQSVTNQAGNCILLRRHLYMDCLAHRIDRRKEFLKCGLT